MRCSFPLNWVIACAICAANAGFPRRLSRAGIASNTYQKFEKGESRPGTPMNPEFYTLVALCRALDTDLKTLLDF